MAPSAACCRWKLVRLRPPTVLTTMPISPRNRKVISVSHGLSTSIITTVPTKVSTLETMLAKLLLSISDTVSISLVKRLIRSPDWWRS